MSRIIEDYRHTIVRFLKLPWRKGSIYLCYSNSGFEVSDREEEDCFYYKFENVSKRLARKITGLARSVRYTGIFFRDKAVLDDLVQQNL